MDVCDADCVPGGWGEWGDCSADCGGGTQTRNLDSFTPLVGSGNDCEHSQTRDCNMDDCAPSAGGSEYERDQSGGQYCDSGDRQDFVGTCDGCGEKKSNYCVDTSGTCTYDECKAFCDTDAGCWGFSHAPSTTHVGANGGNVCMTFKSCNRKHNIAGYELYRKTKHVDLFETSEYSRMNDGQGQYCDSGDRQDFVGTSSGCGEKKSNYCVDISGTCTYDTCKAFCDSDAGCRGFSHAPSTTHVGANGGNVCMTFKSCNRRHNIAGYELYQKTNHVDVPDSLCNEYTEYEIDGACCPEDRVVW